MSDARASLRHASIAALIALGGSLLASCASSPDDSKDPRLVVDSADPAAFRLGVDAVFERRCASLDCHGSNARGLRLYSANGLRLANDKGNVPGVGPTSADEINANYASVVGLQPEKINAFLEKNPRTADDAYQLIVLTKPLGLERHKGGAALSKGEPAEQCIVTWLTGKADQAQCAKGSAPP
jgi:hypothetical protein